jgi:glycosyltransferase involved in cell wall biosynthesis
MTKKYKILVVGNIWDYRVMNMNLGKLISNLNYNGQQILFYCQPSSNDHNFLENFPNAKLLNYRFSGSIKGFGIIRFIFKTSRLLLSNRPDLVLWSYVGFLENTFFALLGIPFVLKTDSDQMQKPKSLLGRLKYRLFVEYPIKKAKYILVETTDVGERLKNLVDRDVYLFPNGVPVKRFTQYEEQFQKKNVVANPYILYTGRIMHEKGVDLLLEAFSGISKKYPDWRLLIVGSVVEREYMNGLKDYVVQNNLSNNVIFIPFKTGIDLYELYHFAEIFVLPSRHEGLANRLTEAMFFKNPIVAFDVNQTKALVTDCTGEIVPPLDVAAFSERMEFLVNNEDIRKNKGRQARSVIEQNYNDDEIFPDLLKKIGVHQKL